MIPRTMHKLIEEIRKEILDILDWNDIYYRILEYKNEREIFNIDITKEDLKQIIYNQKYTLLCDPELIEPKTFQAIEQTTDIVTLLLQKYLNLYYQKKRNAAEKTHIELKPLKQEDDNILTMYRIQLNEEDQMLISNLENLIQTSKIYNLITEQKLTDGLRTYIDQTPATLKLAPFKGHLYQPLLVKQDNSSIVTIPTGLNTGSAEHNTWLASYAISKGMRIRYSEGLIKEGKVIAGEDEQSVFEALGLPYPVPNEREIADNKPLWMPPPKP